MSSEMLQMMKNKLNQQKVTALVTITFHPEPSYLGKMLLVCEDGSSYYEQSEMEFFEISIKEWCQHLIQKRKSKTITIQINNLDVEFFVEVVPPPPHLIIAGAGHVGKALVQMSSMLGYYITIVDDRPEFARQDILPLANEVICESYIEFFQKCTITANTWIVLLTRGHQFDVFSLQELLKRTETPAYIGMIGSRRRIAGVFEELREEFPDNLFDHIYTPVGLDLGAETPSEIAVSILAEMLKVKNNKSGHSLSTQIRRLAKLGFRGG